MVIWIINCRMQTDAEGYRLQILGCTMDKCRFNATIGSQLMTDKGADSTVIVDF